MSKSASPTPASPSSTSSSSSFPFKVGKIDNNSLAFSNNVYLSAQDISKFAASPYLNIKTDAGELVFNYAPLEGVPVGEVQLNGLQRRTLDASLGQPCKLSPYIAKGDGVYLASLELEVGFLQTKKQDAKTYKADQLESIIQTNFKSQCFTLGEELCADVAGTTLIFRVLSLDCISVDDKEKSRRKRGILQPKTSLNFAKAKDSAIKISGVAKNAAMPFGPDFNFEKMGIGGLDKEFAGIFRRAFASRVYPPEVVTSIGIKHVKGMLLYGPPGTGKTLIARKIGQMLNAREPKLVNGPEVLNKFVGQSEENIRALFADAEREYKEKGDESELHIIIFDEIDAICKERGSRSTGGTGVGDSMVNQLLSKLDGVEQVNNVLVIGMTNRKDMIDEALLRPGRLEVHMEIGLPDESGRVQILTIHTSKMRESGYMGSDVSLAELAKETKNYSGAEIEGVVRSATSFALNRNVDTKTMKNTDPKNIRITREDFLNALNEVKPAFGAAEDELTAAMTNGIINFGDAFADVYQSANLLIEQVRNSARTPIVSILLEGKAGAGKTALAAKLALGSGFAFSKLLSPDNFVGYQEQARVLKIQQAFEDAYKSQTSLIIIDDIERFLDYTPIGPRFSNAVLQALLVLFRRVPPKGRKLLVMGTTSNVDILGEMGFLQAASAVLHVPSLTDGQQVKKVLFELGGFSPSELDEVARGWNGKLEMKRLIMLAEMAKQLHIDTGGASSGVSLGRRFLDMVALRG